MLKYILLACTLGYTATLTSGSGYVESSSNNLTYSVGSLSPKSSNTFFLLDVTTSIKPFETIQLEVHQGVLSIPQDAERLMIFDANGKQLKNISTSNVSEFSLNSFQNQKIYIQLKFSDKTMTSSVVQL